MSTLFLIRSDTLTGKAIAALRAHGPLYWRALHADYVDDAGDVRLAGYRAENLRRHFPRRLRIPREAGWDVVLTDPAGNPSPDDVLYDL
jgi:hypothetical protein